MSNVEDHDPARIRGDVQHHVSPVVGWMRRAFHDQTGGVDPLKVPDADDRRADVAGLPDSISVDTRMFVAMVRHLNDALAATRE